MDWLGKLLFPQAQRGERRKKLRTLTGIIIVALLVSAAVAAGMYWYDVHGKH